MEKILQFYKKERRIIIFTISFIILAILQWGYFAGKEDKQKANTEKIQTVTE